MRGCAEAAYPSGRADFLSKRSNNRNASYSSGPSEPSQRDSGLVLCSPGIVRLPGASHRRLQVHHPESFRQHSSLLCTVHYASAIHSLVGIPVTSSASCLASPRAVAKYMPAGENSMGDGGRRTEDPGRCLNSEWRSPQKKVRLKGMHV